MPDYKLVFYMIDIHLACALPYFDYFAFLSDV
jgi:hypothetical protein